MVAGHIAYMGLFALFPFLIFLLALAGFLGQGEAAAEAIELSMELLPPDVASALRPAVAEVVGAPHAGLMTFGILVTLVGLLLGPGEPAPRAEPRLSRLRRARLLAHPARKPAPDRPGRSRGDRCHGPARRYPARSRSLPLHSCSRPRTGRASASPVRASRSASSCCWRCSMLLYRVLPNVAAAADGDRAGCRRRLAALAAHRLGLHHLSAQRAQLQHHLRQPRRHRRRPCSSSISPPALHLRRRAATAS